MFQEPKTFFISARYTSGKYIVSTERPLQSMRPNMSEEKKTTDSPTFVVASTEAFSSNDPAKRQPYKKYVVIAISAILTVAVILAAILVGMYLFTEANKEITKFAYSRDQNTKEEVTSDPNTNIVKYHVSSDAYEMWVVDDFNRDIRVMKIHSSSGTNCYVAPLNRTTANDPSKVRGPSDLDAMKRNATYSVTYHSANTPIPDSSFICKPARETCQGISTYWVYPGCDVPEDLNERRHKRLIQLGPFVIGICFKFKVFNLEVEICF